MSSERPFVYRVHPRTPVLNTLWFTMCAPPHAAMPSHLCRGGTSGPEEITVWIHANPTKAKRVAVRLDAYFGSRGELVDEATFSAELAEDELDHGATVNARSR